MQPTIRVAQDANSIQAITYSAAGQGAGLSPHDSPHLQSTEVPCKWQNAGFRGGAGNIGCNCEAK